MPGHPKRKALDKKLREYAKDSGAGTALEFVAMWMEGGHTLLQLETKLNMETGLGYHQHAIRRHLEREFGREAVTTAFAAARSEGAHALVEEAIQIVDNAPADRDELTKAKGRADVRLWAAGRANRQAYGDAKQEVNIALNLPSLHLDAMRHREVAAPPKLALAPAEEAVIVEDDDNT